MNGPGVVLMRKFLIGVAVVAAVIGLAVGLHYAFPPTYVGICANTKTHVRLPDKDCQPRQDANDDWVYYNSDDSIPAVGDATDDGAADAPDPDEVKRGGVPAQGQQANSNSDGNGNTGFSPGEDGGGGSDVGVNSGGDDGGENAGSGGGGDDGE